jgi:hypothetical protein
MDDFYKTTPSSRFGFMGPAPRFLIEPIKCKLYKTKVSLLENTEYKI